jgi:hypothetical protein
LLFIFRTGSFKPKTPGIWTIGLLWMYFENDEQAKSSFEGYSPQIKKQMKKFKQVVIKLSILSQEVPAYQLSYTTAQKHKGYEIIAYGKINGHSLMIHLHSQKEVKLSDELHPVFQQLVKFE